MSPSKSMSTPSETGSQDSVEGATVGRYVSPLHLHQLNYPYHWLSLNNTFIWNHFICKYIIICLFFSNVILCYKSQSEFSFLTFHPLHYHTTVQNSALFCTPLINVIEMSVCISNRDVNQLAIVMFCFHYDYYIIA